LKPNFQKNNNNKIREKKKKKKSKKKQKTVKKNQKAVKKAKLPITRTVFECVSSHSREKHVCQRHEPLDIALGLRVELETLVYYIYKDDK
jgi:ABC-type phosphate transport system substrate-binding protein